MEISPQTSRYVVSPQPCYVTTDGLRPKESPRSLGGRRYQRQVSWLMAYNLNLAFPVLDQWQKQIQANHLQLREQPRI